MDLTAPQQRTLDSLIAGGERPSFPGDLAQRLRDRIEQAVRGLELDRPLWLGKEPLNDHARCEGLFAAAVLGEKPPFEHSLKSASGTLMHKAIEVDVGSRDELDPNTLVAAAVDRLAEDARFPPYWRDLDRLAQDEVSMEAVRRVAMFQASFPPLRELRRELSPIPELRVRAELLGGALVLSGQVDLVLGRPDPARPNLATRLAIDLKSGRAYPEHPEDMRFYALLMTLRFGVPPYRVASLFLDSGEWQSEDVNEATLEHSSDRVISAARAAAALTSGREVALSPGVYCSWCPRATDCPAALRKGGASRSIRVSNRR